MASAAMHAAAVACIYSSSISLPLSPPHPVRPARRYSAPPLRATWRGMAGDIAAIAAAEGAATASGATAASLPPPSSSPSSPHSSSPSSSADASASSADPASPPHHTSKRQYEIGALQQLPAVSPAAEIIGTALRRAKHVRASKGIMNAVKRERSKGAQQLDCLTKWHAWHVWCTFSSLPRIISSTCVISPPAPCDFLPSVSFLL
ncbi:hypothetical protein CLOM_g20625 [Closterium sp. NIES-68]|nr:hypothetical protein CLOM_g20625 [Closterium sp. NIES-68]